MEQAYREMGRPFHDEVSGAMRPGSRTRPGRAAGRTVPVHLVAKGVRDVRSLLPERLPSFPEGGRVEGYGDWELERLLGAGDFREMWLAWHVSLPGRRAASKFCPDEVFARQLQREAEGIAGARLAGFRRVMWQA